MISKTASAAIQVEALRYTYPPILIGDPDRVALDGISFEVAPGGCLAVTGSNGCGKTTLCLAVSGLAPRLTGGHMAGRIHVAGRDVQAEPPGALADVLGLVLQDTTGQLFNPTIEDEIGWGLENLAVPPSEMPERIEQALSAVGLIDLPRSQPPLTLSGGQQKRLALAAALALRPQVLILDQPSGGLSPLARAELISVLKDLRQKSGLTLLFAENDPVTITALADDILVLDQGHIIARGTLREIYAVSSAHQLPGVAVPPAGQFAAAVNRTLTINGQGGLACLTAAEAADQVEPYALSKPTRTSSGDLNPVQTDDDSVPAVEIGDLSFVYPTGQAALNGVSLTISQGQFVALTGDNGAGKTTLAKHLIGLLRPNGRVVRVMGEDAAGLSVGRLARQVGFAFQNPELQIFSTMVREEIAFGPRNLGMEGHALDVAVEDALRRFGLESIADYPPAALSFSQRRLVALAGIAAMNTPILVLDEPTVGLDAREQARIIDWLVDHHRRGGTVILITHDMEIAARCAGRVIVMDSGRIAGDGPPADVFARPDVLARSGLEAPFAVEFARRLGRPDLAGDLTPEGAARAWLEARR